MIPFWAQCLASFGLMVVIDVAWTLAVRYTSQGRAIPAALASVAITLSGSAGLLLIVHDAWLLIPESLGAFVGTNLAIRYDHRNGKGAVENRPQVGNGPGN